MSQNYKKKSGGGGVMIYGLRLSESGACVIQSSYWESRLPSQNRFWLSTDQTDQHGHWGLSSNTPLDAINPDPSSSRRHLLSSDAGGGWSAAWTWSFRLSKSSWALQMEAHAAGSVGWWHQRINSQLILLVSGLIVLHFLLFPKSLAPVLNDANLWYCVYFCETVLLIDSS